MATLEGHHGRSQALIGGLAGEVAALSAELALGVDFERRDERKAFADVLELLCRLGVLRQRDGSSDAFVARDEALEEALFDIDHARLGDLKSTPLALTGIERVEELLAEEYPASEDGDRARRRHRIARTLVEEPVLYVGELDDAEQDSYRSQRHRLEPELEALTGLQAERRAEGSALIDPSRRLTDVRFPSALEREPARAAGMRAPTRSRPRLRLATRCPRSEVEAALAELRERVGLDAGPELDRAALTLLEAHRLLAHEEPAQVRVLPAAARFARPTLRLKEPEMSITVLHPAPVGRPGRFRLNRAGLIGLYEYEDETFEFEHGRLLLRGPNGSGKSKALELLLPLLLDGELRPERLDPFGGRGRSMRWNLIGDQESRAPAVGFSWLELHRRDEQGVEHFHTLVLMARANKGETGVKSWFALLEARQPPDGELHGPRIGINAFLQQDRHPIARAALAELGRADRVGLGLPGARERAPVRRHPGSLRRDRPSAAVAAQAAALADARPAGAVGPADRGAARARP